MNSVTPGMPCATMMVQNWPCVPTEGPTSGALGLTNETETGVPYPRIGDWATAWMDDSYNRARVRSPYPCPSRSWIRAQRGLSNTIAPTTIPPTIRPRAIWAILRLRPPARRRVA